MKLMFASDIHGDLTCCEKMIDIYFEEKAEKLILLGDILYHGPRNDIPDGYNPKGVASLLNKHKNELLCVRGNCDAEVDQMMLEFPILSDYMVMWLGGKMVFATHGHIYNTSNPPMLKNGDILIHGHTHILTAEEQVGYVYINPGSVSLPKNGNKKSYMIFENNTFTIKSLAGEIIKEYKI